MRRHCKAFKPVNFLADGCKKKAHSLLPQKHDKLALRLRLDIQDDTEYTAPSLLTQCLALRGNKVNIFLRNSPYIYTLMRILNVSKA
jgi:hypothetical protein